MSDFKFSDIEDVGLGITSLVAYGFGTIAISNDLLPRENTADSLGLVVNTNDHAAY